MRAYLKGPFVYKWMLRNQLTVAEAAEKIGISRAFLYRLLNEEAPPSPSMRKKLMKTLGEKKFEVLFKIKKVPPK